MRRNLNKLSLKELEALIEEKIKHLHDMRKKEVALEAEIDLITEAFCKKNEATYVDTYPINTWYEDPADDISYGKIFYPTELKIVCPPHSDAHMEYMGLEVVICDNAEDVLYYANDIDIREFSNCSQVFYISSSVQNRTDCLPHPLPPLTALVKYGISLEQIEALPLRRGEDNKFVVVGGKFCKVRSCTSNLEA